MAEEEHTFETLINTNLASAYHLTRALMPHIPQHQGAHIFNMCSTASITPYINGGSYCISKFALLGFSKVLREELKQLGIKVTAILPGPTLTDSWAGANLPDSRFMTAKDIADTLWAAYSLSPAANIEEILMRPLPGDI
jgi:short-subunit dehydrogenase